MMNESDEMYVLLNSEKIIPFPSIEARVWEQEPDRDEWMVSGIAQMRVKMHRRKRIDKKWRKRYGFQPKPIQLHCLMLRHPQMKHWCGYVGIPRGHESYKIDYGDLVDVETHGGLTFGRICDYEPYRDSYYYLGFDCAHFGDYSPGMEEIFKQIGKTSHRFQRMFGDAYRDYRYVRYEVEALADQLILTRRI